MFASSTLNVALSGRRPARLIGHSVQDDYLFHYRHQYVSRGHLSFTKERQKIKDGNSPQIHLRDETPWRYHGLHT